MTSVRSSKEVDRLYLAHIEFVNYPCVCDRGDISCSNKGKFVDDDDDGIILLLLLLKALVRSLIDVFC